MSTSERKARANHLNAQKSTGPKTDAGKERARANALKHGLSGEGVVVAEAEAQAVAQRMESWRPEYHVDSATKEWAFEQLIVNSVRINACQRQERTIVDGDARRAELVWDVDREADAALLGDRLARKPDVVAKELMKSKHGCLWLMRQWADLDAVLESGKTFTDEHIKHALDLVGVPKTARAELAIDDPRKLVDEHYGRLETLVDDHFEEIDEYERIAASKSRPKTLNKAIALLRRYEAACLKRFHAARKLLECTTVESIEASARPLESVSATVPAPAAEEVSAAGPNPFVEYMTRMKAFGAYDKAYDAATESEREALMPDLPPELLAGPRLRHAVPTPAAPYARPLNRKQRKALAKLTAQGK